MDFNNFCYWTSDVFSPFIGKSESELRDSLSIDSTSKNKCNMYARAILKKADSDIIKTLSNENILLKTIRLKKTGRVAESMSFARFDFKKIILENWETSELKSFFEKTIFLFVVFAENNDGLYLSKIKVWKIPSDVLEDKVYEVWKKTVEVLKSGDIIAGKVTKGLKTTYKTNLPSISFNGICHVRPHAQNSSDDDFLPFPDKSGLIKLTKQCFWLNSGYLKKIISE